MVDAYLKIYRTREEFVCEADPVSGVFVREVLLVFVKRGETIIRLINQSTKYELADILITNIILSTMANIVQDKLLICGYFQNLLVYCDNKIKI